MILILSVVVRKYYLFLFIFTCLLFIHVTTAQAASFSSQYQVAYDLKENGVAKVTYNITLTDLNSDIYASSYTLTVHSPKITNVTAADEEGSVTPELEITDDQAIIHVPLSSTSGQSKRFTLSYESLDVAQKYGQVWEVVIPKIAPSPEIQLYDVSVTVPDSWGPSLLVHPTPRESKAGPPAGEAGEGRKIFLFDKNQIQEFGALLNFGKEQYYTVSLTYHLKNPREEKIRTQIALPPDVKDYQEVFYPSLSPSPDVVEQDGDGNYLATYALDKLEQLDVILNGLIHITAPQPRNPSALTAKDIPSEIVANYTKPLPYWEVEDKEIKRIAEEQTSSVQNSVYAQAQSLYQYVAKQLTYDQGRLVQGQTERFGALKALANPTQAVCMEYTDLLITLLRAKGIPAREINGYAYTPDEEYLPTIGDVLHSWVEVYIPPQGWVSVDPTWGSTTKGLDYFSRFDASHVYFSIKGLSSEWPYPAGAYKLSPDQVGDIKIKFSDEAQIKEFQESQPSIKVNLSMPSKQVSGLPVAGEVVVVNSTGLSLRNVDIIVEDQSRLRSVLQEKVDLIPPFGTVTKTFYLVGGSWFNRLSTNLTAKVMANNGVGEGTASATVSSQPFLLYFLIALGIFGGILLCGILWFRVRKRRFQ